MRTSPYLAAALLSLGGCELLSPVEAPWNTYPGWQNHTSLPLQGSAHEPDPTDLTRVQGCDDCHGGDASGPFTSFRQFDCTGCHGGWHAKALMDNVHAAKPPCPTPPASVPAAPAEAQCYAWRSDYCLSCHQKGEALLNHDKFPVGPGTKHNRICSACHVNATDRANVTNAGLRCFACHSDTSVFPLPTIADRHRRAGAVVLDYPVTFPAASTSDCLRCHADAQVDRIAQHGRRRAANGESAGPGDGDHSTHCFDCHDVVGVAGPPALPWAQDWKSATGCNKCHN
ncbi:MAG TPA: hypothetical protein VH880_15275 [Anaeromyxobacteraceae bacterium]